MKLVNSPPGMRVITKPVWPAFNGVKNGRWRLGDPAGSNGCYRSRDGRLTQQAPAKTPDLRPIMASSAFPLPIPFQLLTTIKSRHLLLLSGD
ncbi:hypothetical protein PX554_22940 [Sphingomonas sp. H39-1-10]|uniref:hypothetical protein n=1 Tax=Sphingomonas pollutisoli TaxID=3030829 RepID=UPI0023B91C95|nr:hypothetical protein [Sphingomonas pollutisoli]MDF0490983.1 hypothetical protein [Sphingomonas pollutisoli]